MSELNGGAQGTMLSLNGVLLRPGSNPGNAWTDNTVADLQMFSWENRRLELLNLEDVEIFNAADAGDMVVALLRRFAAPPGWQSFIKSSFDLETFGSARESLGAAVFWAVSAAVDSGDIRWVAWTFGTAGRALKRSAQDPRFGLLAVLNLLVVPFSNIADIGNAHPRRRRSPQLKEMRYRTTAPFAQQTGHRATRDIPVDGFRVDRTSDLVAAVGGTGADPALTTSTLLGGRSIRFKAWITKPDELTDLATIALDRSAGTQYKEMFSWIDNICPVDDPFLINDLREQLAKEIINNPDTAMIDTILPDDLGDVGEDRFIKYIVFPHERRIGQGNLMLTMASVARLLSRAATESAKGPGLDQNLRFLDAESEIIGSATVLECITATLKRGNADFIAYDGDFYSVNSSFVARINAELELLSVSEIVFPQYSGETEPSYNDMVGRDYPNSFVKLDGALIELPGEHGVEPADLVSSSGALIHVKRKGKSSVLSHLFLQAANSCELLRRSTDAWQQLSQLIIERAANDQIVERITTIHAMTQKREADLEVAFAFLGDWRNRTVTNLPLFSRISLVNEARRVSNLGFTPTIAMISTR